MFKQFKNKFFALLALFPIVGCATSYQKEGFFTNGYSDSHLEDSFFTVNFSANEYTDPEVVHQYALRRAAELTLKRGYLYFAVIEQKNRGKRGKVPALPYPSTRLTIQCFHEMPIGIDAYDATYLLAYSPSR